MVPQRDLGRALLGSDAVQDAAAQPRAQSAHGFAFGNHALDHCVGVAEYDAVLDAALFEIAPQTGGVEAGMSLVERHRDDVEVGRRALPQVQKHVQHDVAVLAAGHARHDAVAVLDHAKVFDGAADLAAQSLAQNGAVALRFARVFAGGKGHHDNDFTTAAAAACNRHGAAIKIRVMNGDSDAPALGACRRAVACAGGWIPFDRYMDIALHAPEVGFYGGGRVRFGISGDFVTAPHVSPLFASALARQAAQFGGAVLELGAGDGALASGMLAALDADGIAADYRILETSAALRARQRERLRDMPATWVDEIPADFCGLILMCEVLDAVPFKLFAKRAGAWRERGVRVRDGSLEWEERSGEENEALERLTPLDLPDGYQAEVSPRAEALAATLCGNLKEGAVLVCDYGFGRAEYYHPQRGCGTLMCHRAGRADSDPLESPGDKDITAHVDFTAIAVAGAEGGASLAGYTSQAHFLVNCGIAGALEEASRRESAADYAALAAGAHKLLEPHEMGELFKFMLLAKGEIPPPCGFAEGDRRRQLSAAA